MRYQTITLPVLVLLSALASCVLAQAPSDRSPKLDPVFSDDFQMDSRLDYQIDGDVSWETGKLTLADEASVTRVIDGGAWGKVELDFGDAAWAAGESSAELQIWFLLDGATNCFVRLRRSADADQPNSIALVDTREGDGQLVTEVVREMPLTEGIIHRLNVTYRNGLVVVTAGDAQIMVSHIANDAATVRAGALVSELGSCVIQSWSVSALPIPPTLTNEQQRLATEADSANGQLIAAYQQANLAEAVKNGERALSLRGELFGEEHPEIAISLNNLAFLYSSMGEYARAEPLYVKARNIDKKVLGEEHPDYATSLNNLAALYENLGEYTRAEPLLLEARDVWKKVLGEEHRDYALSLNNLAVLYDSMGEHAQAEPLYVQALYIRKKVLGEEHPDYAQSLNNLAALNEAKGEFARAEPLYLQARDIRKKVLGEEHREYAISLNNLANLYLSMGEYARAEPLFIKAHDILKKVLGEEHPDYATSLNNLAGLYESIGEFARAEPLYEQARDIRKKVLGEEHPEYATSLNNLANLYLSMGDYARSEPLFIKAHDILKKVLGKEHPNYALTLNNLAELYQLMGEYSQAEPLLEQARANLKQLLGEDHPDYALSLNNLAAMYESIGDYARAEPLYLQGHRVLAATATKVVPSLSETQARGWISANRPRTDLVLSVLRVQQKWASPEAYSAVWKTKGLVRRLRVAQSFPADASTEARQVFAELRDARLKLAKLVSATPAPEQAEAYRQQLAAASEQKEVLEKRLSEVNAGTAQEFAVRDAVVEDLLKQLPDGVAVVDFVRLDDWNFVDTEISFEDEDGNREIRTVKKEQARSMYDAFVLRSDQRQETSPARWIPLGAAEPIEESLAAWRRSLIPTNAIVGDEIASSPQVRNPEQQLRKLIWDKLEPHMDGIHTVVLIPDGELHRLPWAALPGREPGRYLIEDYALTTAESGQMLYGSLAFQPKESQPNLLVVGGIDYDTRPQSRSTKAESDLMFAGVGRPINVSAQGESGWIKLPGTKKEADVIAGLWGDRGSVRLLEKLQADEYSLARLLPKSRFAHLATHGFFDTRGEIYGKNLREQSLFESSLTGSQRQASVAYRNPLLMTGIVMAGANVPPEKDEYGLPVGEDGILTAEEISGLDLRSTELVTLSACETGLGDIAAGQGVFGLQRALHQAGARSVIASLWKVSDQATQALMVEFYKNLWDKKMSKLEALRQAQLTIIERYDPKEGQLRSLGLKPVRPKRTGRSGDTRGKRLSPWYWAAFQLSGDWR